LSRVAHGGGDLASRFLGGFGAAPGQSAHLVSDNRKSQPASPVRAASVAALRSRFL